MSHHYHTINLQIQLNCTQTQYSVQRGRRAGYWRLAQQSTCTDSDYCTGRAHLYLTQSHPSPLLPCELCDAISGAMPGPSGQDCSCPSRASDITPARDGPAHEYPDDGVARANRTRQYNVPSDVNEASLPPG